MGERVVEAAIPAIKVISPQVFRDERGFFLESYNQRWLRDEAGLTADFVQDNQSRSKRHVLRGLHFQNPNPQGKLVRVLSGTIFDVAVDLRRRSPTFGKWVGIFLSARKLQMVWIPEGFAHGFLVLSQRADVLYKTTGYYEPSSEYTLRWDDPTVAIEWPAATPILSPKDCGGKTLGEIPLFP